MNRKEILDRLIDEEGLKLKPYIDTVGKVTIGIGCNLTDVGITKEEAIYLCMNRVDNCIADLKRHLPYFDELPDKAQLVLVDMCYNMGIGTLLTFKNTLLLIEAGEYDAAGDQMLKSMWARQVGVRSINLSNILKSIV